MVCVCGGHLRYAETGVNKNARTKLNHVQGKKQGGKTAQKQSKTTFMLVATLNFKAF